MIGRAGASRVLLPAPPEPGAGTADAGNGAPGPRSPGKGASSARKHEVDADALGRELRRAVSGEVRFGKAARALYATDSSNYRQVPLGLVLPRTLDDVVATHVICHRHGAAIVNRGGGTSLSGETVN